MTKTEVLKDIDRLCADLYRCTCQIIDATKSKDERALCEANLNSTRLRIAAHQELSFLRDYIDDNVKED